VFEEEKLEAIFRTVFSELEGAEASAVRNASRKSLSSWDSANHLLLITCLEEDFNCQIEDGKALAIDSYSSAHSVLSSLNA